MGKLHPLTIYFLVGLITSAYLTYIAYYTVLRKKTVFFLQYSLFNHALSIIFSILAVITGFAQAQNPYIQQKTTFIYMFPHKWLGIALAVYTTVSFFIFWIKQDELDWRVGALLGLIGLGLAVTTVTFGWLLRLMFF